MLIKEQIVVGSPAFHPEKEIIIQLENLFQEPDKRIHIKVIQSLPKEAFFDPFQIPRYFRFLKGVNYKLYPAVLRSQDLEIPASLVDSDFQSFIEISVSSLPCRIVLPFHLRYPHLDLVPSIISIPSVLISAEHLLFDGSGDPIQLEIPAGHSNDFYSVQVVLLSLIWISSFILISKLFWGKKLNTK